MTYTLDKLEPVTALLLLYTLQGGKTCVTGAMTNTSITSHYTAWLVVIPTMVYGKNPHEKPDIKTHQL